MQSITGIVVCLSIFTFSACQKTPDNEAVRGLNEDALLHPRQEDEDGSSTSKTDESMNSDPRVSTNDGEKQFIHKRMEIPESITYIYEKDNFLLSVDAKISVPEIEDIPVYRITKGEFSQDIVDIMWDHFIGDTVMWERSFELTRGEIEGMLLTHKEALRNAPDEETKRHLNGLIDFYEKLYLDAPTENEKIPCDSTIKPTGFVDEGSWGTMITRYNGVSAVNDTQGMHVMNTWDENDATIAEKSFQSIIQFEKEEVEDLYTPVDYDIVSVAEIQKKLLLTEEDAQREIIDLFAKMNVSIIIEKSTIVQNEILNSKLEKIGMGDKFAYRFNILRVTDENIPISQMKRDNSTNYSVNESNEFVEYSLPWDNERIVVTMNDNGVFSFGWMAPIEIQEILNEKSDLLPYEEILEIFAKAIERQYLPRSRSYHILECRVREVRLEMGRIRKQDSMTECLLVPVWNFYGSSAASETEETISDIHFDRYDNTIVLSINAIDGSVINLRDGY